MNKNSIKTIVCAIFLIFTACGGGGKKKEASPEELGGIDVNKPISVKDCDDTFPFVESWTEELMQKIKTGEASCVKKILTEQPGINLNESIVINKFFGDDSAIPVWYAMDSTNLFFTDSKQRYAVLKVLLDAGANSELKNSSGRTILHESILNSEISEKFPEVAKYLVLSKKVKINAKDNLGETSVHQVMSTGNRDLLKILISEKANLEVKNNRGINPLFKAYNSNFESGVNLLIAQNVNINILDSSKNTPLMRSIQNNFKSSALELIDRTRDLNAANLHKKTALFMSLEKNNIDVFNRLMSKNVNVDKGTDDISPIHLALDLKNQTVSLAVINKMKRVNSQDSRGRAPMHIASKNSDLAAIKALLRKGANANIKNNNGSTALHTVRELKVLKILVENGGNVNVVNGSGESVLSSATRNMNLKAVDFLLRKGADITWRSSNGNGLLHLASNLGKAPIAEKYIGLLNVDALNQKGETPLFLANDSKMIRLLLDRGANIDAINVNDETPLFSAVVKSIRSIDDSNESDLRKIKELIRMGADVDFKNRSRNTILHVIVRTIPKASLFNEGQKDLVFPNLLKLVLNKTLNPSVRNRKSNTPLHLADSVQEVRMLADFGARTDIENFNGQTPFSQQLAKVNIKKNELEILRAELLTLETKLKKAEENSNGRRVRRLTAKINDKEIQIKSARMFLEVNKKLLSALRRVSN